MAFLIHSDSKKLPKHKIELHIHLEATVRHTTLWELAQKKGIDLQSKTLEEFIDKCKITKPTTLDDFLAPLAIITPCFVDDYEAIERIAYEFCEDIAKQGVLYCEVRYGPHRFCLRKNEDFKAGDVKPRQVVRSINKGLTRGQRDFGVKVRTILALMRRNPEWSEDIFNLCKEFRNEGVVGIDIAGPETPAVGTAKDIAIYKEAAALGIHRTAHAAEAGPGSNVAVAVDEMKVERIGHGYHIFEEEQLYRRCLNLGIHFESCPHSSYMTGSVPLSTTKHPIVRYAEDNANFSISRDDPVITQKTLYEEYDLLRRLGLNEVHLVRANFNAARSCFLPEAEKQELIQELMKVYGVTQ